MASWNPGGFPGSPYFGALLAPRFHAGILSSFRATHAHDEVSKKETTRSLRSATAYCLENIDKKAIHYMWSEIRT